MSWRKFVTLLSCLTGDSGFYQMIGKKKDEPEDLSPEEIATRIMIARKKK